MQRPIPKSIEGIWFYTRAHKIQVAIPSDKRQVCPIGEKNLERSCMYLATARETLLLKFRRKDSSSKDLPLTPSPDSSLSLHDILSCTWVRQRENPATWLQMRVASLLACSHFLSVSCAMGRDAGLFFCRACLAMRLKGLFSRAGSLCQKETFSLANS